MSRGGKHRASRGDVIHGPRIDSDTIYVDFETAAELLGLSIVELQWLCREGFVPHADLGAGYDQRGIHHDNLIVFTPDELEQIHRQAKRQGPWVGSIGRNTAEEPHCRPDGSGTSTSLSNDDQRRDPGRAVS